MEFFQSERMASTELLEKGAKKRSHFPDPFSVREIERQLRMPQASVSKHLRVLREAGCVEFTVDAQRRIYRRKPQLLQELDAWLAPFRRFWSAHLDALERHPDRVYQSEIEA